MQPLSPAIKTVWTIKWGLFSAVVVLGMLTFEVFRLFGDNDGLPFGVMTGVLLVFLGAITVGLPRLSYRFWRFELSEQELYLERGIFNRVRTVVPLRRIQHLDVSQDVFERNFDLGKLIVHTAGTRSSDVELPGLDFAEAERLRDQVKHYITEDAV